MIKIVDKLDTDLKESIIVSGLMVDFPPISKEDNSEVLVAYVTDLFEKTERSSTIDPYQTSWLVLLLGLPRRENPRNPLQKMLKWKRLSQSLRSRKGT